MIRVEANSGPIKVKFIIGEAVTFDLSIWSKEELERVKEAFRKLSWSDLCTLKEEVEKLK